MSSEKHMNILHAERFTAHLGKCLIENYDVTDKRSDPAFASWHEDNQYVYQQK